MSSRRLSADDALRRGAHDVAAATGGASTSASAAFSRVRSASSSMRADTPIASPRGMYTR